MSSQGNFGSSMLFQTINDDLNASLATADELSREFSALLQEISVPPQCSSAQSSSSNPQATISSNPLATTNTFSATTSSSSSGGSSVGASMSGSSGTVSSRATMSLPQTSTITRSTEPSTRSVDSTITSGRNPPFPPSPQTPQAYPYTSAQSFKVHGHLTPPNMSPHTQRRASPTPVRSHERSMSGSFSYSELNPMPSQKYDHMSAPNMLQFPANPVAGYESSSTGRRSPRIDRAPSPSPLSQPAANTLPRNFIPFKLSDEGMQRQKSPSKWNETDLDVSYEKKPHHTYDKNEWIRPSVPNSNWRESNLDSPSTPRKDPLPRHLQPTQGSLPRNTRISVPPDRASPTQSPYAPQPIISRISIPPSAPQLRQHRPIPLSVIMRLQNPYYTAFTHYPHGLLEGEIDLGLHRQPLPPLPRDFMYQFQPQPSEQRQPAYYGEVLSSADVDAEVERLNTVKPPSVLDGPVPSADQSKEMKVEGSTEDPEPPRPLSPTRLQPVVAPEVPVVPDLEELLRLRAEIPRALKKRGSVDQSHTLKKLPIIQPNQYKQMINKLFRRKGLQLKGETGSESSSSEGEESNSPPTPSPPPLMNANIAQPKGLHSILRKSNKGIAGKAQIPRARLSPLVLLLDGALVGELDTVQRAVQEMSDPSQSNDEGITALHNAICGGHYAVVEFLVRIGANVSAPDSHGWTPLHCAASCNDRALCEFLVRNGAAVMAVTESDGATAAQKCDPYAPGYEECESFLRGVEEAMGVENSGVLYALWSYPAQAPDELSFKEGDMVTILQKPEGVDWWWASLCGREGFIPNNYFGLFPKVRPRSLC
ncbi:relA-associated inhibitor [Colossoma macropomum]|uniref:relA-associated inhibitor n=1 Tax=Colossoma macropomum TaxID=42526 RepID=UPI001865063E|nr:relA-associated inhibitor [Colossoma macropomum]